VSLQDFKLALQAVRPTGEESIKHMREFHASQANKGVHSSSDINDIDEEDNDQYHNVHDHDVDNINDEKTSIANEDDENANSASTRQGKNPRRKRSSRRHKNNNGHPASTHALASQGHDQDSSIAGHIDTSQISSFLNQATGQSSSSSKSAIELNETLNEMMQLTTLYLGVREMQRQKANRGRKQNYNNNKGDDDDNDDGSDDGSDVDDDDSDINDEQDDDAENEDKNNEHNDNKCDKHVRNNWNNRNNGSTSESK
jgi:hypothetical protein